MPAGEDPRTRPGPFLARKHRAPVRGPVLTAVPDGAGAVGGGCGAAACPGVPGPCPGPVPGAPAPARCGGLFSLTGPGRLGAGRSGGACRPGPGGAGAGCRVGVRAPARVPGVPVVGVVGDGAGPRFRAWPAPCPGPGGTGVPSGWCLSGPGVGWGFRWPGAALAGAAVFGCGSGARVVRFPGSGSGSGCLGGGCCGGHRVVFGGAGCFRGPGGVFWAVAAGFWGREGPDLRGGQKACIVF